MAMIHAFVTLSLFGGALAQVISFGFCPQVVTVPDFNLSKYMGRWYEAERYFAAFEIGAKCVTADYSPGANNTIAMINSQISENGSRTSINATASTPNPAQPGRLQVKYPSIPFSQPHDYWVLGTDYDSYAVVYSCTNLLLTNMKFAWILTRAQNAPGSVITAAYKVVTDNELSTQPFTVTDQFNCAETTSSTSPTTPSTTTPSTTTPSTSPTTPPSTSTSPSTTV